jgi:hypothetical protein
VRKGEILEEYREIAPFAENVCQEVLDRTVTIQKLGGGPGADPRNANWR